MIKNAPNLSSPKKQLRDYLQCQVMNVIFLIAKIIL